MPNIRAIDDQDEKDFNALCERYKEAFPNAEPPPDFWDVTFGYVATIYDPFFQGVEKAVKTGIAIKDWASVVKSMPIPDNAVA